MDITVIICTYNRSKELKKCLEALEGQVVPESLSWEVLIVDNNSIDDTKVVVEEVQKNSRLNIKYVFEEQQGLSFSRNKGAQEAAGGLVAYIDDDCIPEKEWLSNMFKTFSDHSADCVGGKIVPIEWPKKIPKWFNKELYPYVGIYDKGDEAVELGSDVGTPFGGNICYRKSIFQKTGLFDVSLGRQGKHSAGGGEEQEINQKILIMGGRIFYQPKAVAHHPLRPEMLTKQYIRRLDFCSGEREGLKLGEYEGRNIFGIPLYRINQFFRSLFRYIKYIIKDGYNKSFRKELYCWYFLGIIKARFEYWQSKKKLPYRLQWLEQLGAISPLYWPRILLSLDYVSIFSRDKTRAGINNGIVRSLVLRINGPKILGHTLSACEKLGMKPFLNYGTLLGYYRDNGFIKDDWDIDLGLLEADIPKVPLLTKALREKGILLTREDEYHVAYCYHPCLTHLDIYYFFRKQDKTTVHHYNIPKKELYTFTFSFDIFEKFNKVKFLNKFEVLIPDKTEKFLIEHYGTWRIPKKDLNPQDYQNITIEKKGNA